MLDIDLDAQKLRDTGDELLRPLSKKKFDCPTYLRKRIYILTWMRTYNRSFALSDIIAGITLGLLIIPQAIAYASLAGLPSQYGLYSAFAGLLLLEMIIPYL